MMIARPLTPAAPNGPRGSSTAPMQPQPWQFIKSPRQRAIQRTSPFAFKPRPLIPVNLTKGTPRLYG
jgi:hypothetical protein